MSIQSVFAHYLTDRRDFRRSALVEFAGDDPRLAAGCRVGNI